MISYVIVVIVAVGRLLGGFNRQPSEPYRRPVLPFAVSGLALIFLGLVLFRRDGKPVTLEWIGVKIHGPVGAILIIAGFAVGIYGLVNYWVMPTAEIHEPRGSITSHKDGQAVERQIVVAGTQAAIPPEARTYLLVKIVNLDSYYPALVEVLPDGRWTARATIGSEDGLCAAYQLALVMAVEDGAEKLRSYLANDKGQGIRPLDILSNPTVTVLDTVSLTRARVLLTNPTDARLGQVEKCDGPTGDRDLNQYCRTKGFPDGVELSLGVNGGAHNNWRCRSASSSVDHVEACAYSYPQRRVVLSAPNNDKDPYTWRCYVEPLP